MSDFIQLRKRVVSQVCSGLFRCVTSCIVSLQGEDRATLSPTGKTKPKYDSNVRSLVVLLDSQTHFDPALLFSLQPISRLLTPAPGAWPPVGQPVCDQRASCIASVKRKRRGEVRHSPDSANQGRLWLCHLYLSADWPIVSESIAVPSLSCR